MERVIYLPNFTRYRHGISATLSRLNIGGKGGARPANGKEVGQGRQHTTDEARTQSLLTPFCVFAGAGMGHRRCRRGADNDDNDDDIAAAGEMLAGHSARAFCVIRSDTGVVPNPLVDGAGKRRFSR